MTGFVLIERLATKKQRCPIYFRRMTAIGPMTTAEPKSAAVFADEAAAKACPANYHSLSFYDVVPVDDIDTHVEALMGRGGP